ncbi:MAG: hypothetical protein HQK79_10540 [Desulfobacterales bacterium]|nr:hypothetical protein [Desulfobacterales bacterium]MBF0398126.1 hypothetical protein [Desulfobacterales bacterium]
MNVLPLNLILSSPFELQVVYFVLSFIIALIGINRKMGFWGYLFCSILFSPLIGLMVVMVSAKNVSAKKEDNKIKKQE